MKTGPGSRPRVAIVGAGFCGVMVAANLVRQTLRTTGRGINIVVFDRTGRTGRGPAYSTTDPAHLLNVPAVRMGAWADAPGDFLAWLTGTGRRYGPADFVPRMVYAEYLDAIWRGALAESARAGATLRAEAAEVREIARAPGRGAGLTLTWSDGSLDADAVVLCTGNMQPAPVGGGAGDRVITNPWLASSLDAVGPGDRVVIVGSGLTMLDVVLTLKRGTWGADVRGEIVCLSRHGLMPRAHRADPLQIEPASGSVLSLSVDEASRVLGSPRSALHWVRKTSASLAASTTGEAGHWSHVIDALRAHTQPTWAAWSLAQRLQFVRHLRSIWDVHRHRAAPQVLAEVGSLISAGRFELRAAKVEGWGVTGRRVEVRVRRRGSRMVERLTCDRVVVCTGPNPDIAKSDNDLMSCLRREGLVVRDELGLGVLCEATGRVRTGSGGSVELYAVGPLRRADLWESIAVPELREQAATVARTLADTLAGRAMTNPS